MNRKRYRMVAALLCLSVNLASIAYAGQGAVLCIAHDHVAIEASVPGGCCVEQGTPSRVAPSPSLSRRSMPMGNATHCGPCMDIPLQNEFLVPSSVVSHDHGAKMIAAGVPLDSALVGLVQPSSASFVYSSCSASCCPSMPAGISVLRI